MKWITFILALISLPSIAFSECAEYKVVDHGDRVEVTCVGEPLTEAEKKEMEKLKEVKLNAEKLKVQNLKEDKLTPDLSQQNLINQPSATQTITKVEVPNDGHIEVISHDVKYIPYSSNVINERRRTRKYITSNDTTMIERNFMGDYSIKIVARNFGRRGTVKFKLKITDFSGYEIQSLIFSEDFETDQSKTFTSTQPGNPVTFTKTNDWIIETYKY